MIVLDACVVIALFDSTAAHHAVAKDIVASDSALAMSVFSVAETLVGPERNDAGEQALDNLARLGIRIVPLLEDDARDLARTRANGRPRMPDAAVLHVALRLQATVATFDTRLQAAAVQAGLSVVPAPSSS
ncbi:MAG: PIN domain-containing protein [Bifidobacteriaceae bacterium]|nr:PIN domain-containing protein [Bifidobacteriaceae bacterium]